jgi:hypothetical protein
MRGLLLYTLSRVALFLVIWLPLQLFTSWRGFPALVVAILVSGGISLVVLNRQRNSAVGNVQTFFRRINRRIDESRTAEDYDELDHQEGETPPSASPNPNSAP